MEGERKAKELEEICFRKEQDNSPLKRKKRRIPVPNASFVEGRSIRSCFDAIPVEEADWLGADEDLRKAVAESRLFREREVAARGRGARETGAGARSCRP